MQDIKRLELSGNRTALLSLPVCKQHLMLKVDTDGYRLLDYCLRYVSLGFGSDNPSLIHDIRQHYNFRDLKLTDNFIIEL